DELEAAKASDELKSKSIDFLYEHALYMLVNGEDIESIRREYNGLNLNFARFKRILLVEFNHDFIGIRDVDFK
ncbi:DNA-binding response regulator, partial [Coprococcus eutactus]|nr:DNA-binding response regulator [Coprococcus eutactus]